VKSELYVVYRTGGVDISLEAWRSAVLEPTCLLARPPLILGTERYAMSPKSRFCLSPRAEAFPVKCFTLT
jgi:hypothetical protein